MGDENSIFNKFSKITLRSRKYNNNKNQKRENGRNLTIQSIQFTSLVIFTLNNLSLSLCGDEQETMEQMNDTKILTLTIY